MFKPCGSPRELILQDTPGICHICFQEKVLKSSILPSQLLWGPGLCFKKLNLGFLKCKNMFIFVSQEKIHLFSRESQFGHLVYVEKRGVAINEPLKAFTDSLKKKILRVLV